MHILRLLRDRRSVAALEFALVAGPLVGITLGVYDISQAVIVYNQVETTAHSIASSASTLATTNTADGSTELSYPQVQIAASEIWGDIPSLRADYQDGQKSVTISSIVFEPEASSCNITSSASACFTPVVAWSVVYTGGDSGRSFQVPAAAQTLNVTYTTTSTGAADATGAIPAAVSAAPLRSCFNVSNSTQNGNEIGSSSNLIGSLYQSTAANGATSDLTNLRTLDLTDNPPTYSNDPINNNNYIAPPTPILVVDVHLQYKPLIGLVINQALDFWVTASWPIRSSKLTVAGTTTANMPYTEFTAIAATYLTAQPPSPAATVTLPATNDYCVNTTLTGAVGTAPVGAS